MPSTTLAGLPYPLAGLLNSGLLRLAAIPSRYKELVDLLNEESAAITSTCYLLFRLFGPGNRTYFNRRCPVQHTFATSYGDLPSYPRLVPKSGHGSATLANLRRDLKRVICQVLNRLILPDELVLEEIDMVACHTGIYAGLMGPTKAPNTWEAYQSGSFWAFIMERWGNGCPKPLLKRVLYSGLNGASLTSQSGAIPLYIKEAHSEHASVGLADFQRMVLGNPILQELALFHEMVGSRSMVYLPSQVRPYYGRPEEESLPGRPHSLYHNGLLTSRILASHEVILLMYLVSYIEESRLGIPVSLENDGLVHLTSRSNHSYTFSVLDASLRRDSHRFLGVEIPVERKG